MTTEELLKPRYKVIADYPDSNFKINEILELDVLGIFRTPDANYYTAFFEKYPHLFKKLEMVGHQAR